MVNDIVTGIAVKLDEEFGDKFKIYDSKVRQGTEVPCFYIKLLTTLRTPYIGDRRRISYPFDIHLLPDEGMDDVIMAETGETMMELLKRITLLNGDIVHGRDISFQITDGVLHFFVTYSVAVNNMDRADPMQECEIEVRADG